MFLGHVALGMAAKRAAPRVSLTVLMLAAQLADVIWPVLVSLGIEQVAIEPGNTRVTPLNFISYPYSHSLLTLTLWAIAFAYVFGFSGQRVRPAAAVRHCDLDCRDSRRRRDDALGMVGGAASGGGGVGTINCEFLRLIRERRLR